MSDEKRALARGGALSFLGATTSAVLGFVLTVYLARALGDAGSGVVLQAMSVFAIVLALAKFGMDSTAIWLLPRIAIDNPAAVRVVVVNMAAIVAVTSTVAVLVVQLCVGWIWGDTPDVEAAVRSVVWFIPPGALMLFLVAALRALGNVRTYVLIGNIALPALRLPAVVLAVGLAGSLSMVSVAWASPVVVVMVVAGFVLIRYLNRLGAGHPAQSHPSRLRQIVGYALPRTASSGMEQAIIWIDVLLVGILAGSAAAGVYGGASRFVQAGLVIDAALRVVVSPRFSALLHRKDVAAVQALYRTASGWLVLFASPLYILLAFFAPVALTLLGPEFVPGAAALVVLCLGAIVTFLAGNIHSVLLMSGRSGWVAANKAVVLTVNVVGTLLLVPWIGFIGAAVTWSVCMMLDAALAAFQVWRFEGITMDVKGVGLPLAVTLGTVGVASLITTLVLGQTLVALLVAAATGGAAFVGVCVLLRRSLNLDGIMSALTRK